MLNRPYYDLVPKTLEDNLAFRREVVTLGSTDKASAEEFWIMCSRDLLFYVNTFCWIFEPRSGLTLPFITYPFQDDVFDELLECITTGQDTIVEKSRDMGASWCCVTSMEFLWHFSDIRYTFLLLSRKADLVDKRGDPKTLFYKLDFLHEHQPGWLLPRIDSTLMHRENMDNGATLDGDSTNEFAGVADRRTAILLDEFSKMDNQSAIFRGTRDATNCRLFNYTPQGSGNMAYEIAKDPDRRKLTLHWSIHPLKSIGLYETDGKDITLIDKDYWTKDAIADYPFNRVEPNNPKYRFRSPWYDKQEKRAAHPKELAQELDIDYLGSDYNYFDAATLRKCIERDCRPHIWRGELEYESTGEPIGLSVSQGRWRFWMRPNAAGQLLDDRGYAMGVDVAAGTGASNSAAVIIDTKTGEQVAEFAQPDISPTEFGIMCVAMCRHLRDCKLIWEAPGPGREFGTAVIESGFRNIYYREPDRKKIIKKGGPSHIPGWYPTKDTKREVMGNYRQGVFTGELAIRSRDQLQECRSFVFTANGWILHSGASSDLDPSGARENHGDRPTAGALAWHICRARVKRSPSEGVAIIPYGSLGWRMTQARHRFQTDTRVNPVELIPDETPTELW